MTLSVLLLSMDIEKRAFILLNKHLNKSQRAALFQSQIDMTKKTLAVAFMLRVLQTIYLLAK